MIESSFEAAADLLALAIEAMAVLILFLGSLAAVWQACAGALSHAGDGWKRRVWLNYARWLLLGLEFTLAADIVRSVIAPTWDEIGKLAAIAAIRTVLNYYLAKDLESARSEAVATNEPQCSTARDG